MFIDIICLITWCSLIYLFIHVLFFIFQLNPWPAYIQTRIDLFDKLKIESDAKLAGTWFEAIFSLYLYTRFI